MYPFHITRNWLLIWPRSNKNYVCAGGGGVVAAAAAARPKARNNPHILHLVNVSTPHSEAQCSGLLLRIEKEELLMYTLPWVKLPNELQNWNMYSTIPMSYLGQESWAVVARGEQGGPWKNVFEPQKHPTSGLWWSIPKHYTKLTELYMNHTVCTLHLGIETFSRWRLGNQIAFKPWLLVILVRTTRYLIFLICKTELVSVEAAGGKRIK